MTIWGYPESTRGMILALSVSYWWQKYMGVTINSQYQVDEKTAERYDIPVGIMIYSVADNSPAEQAGLKAGDIIYKVDNTIIQSFDDLSEVIDDSKVGDTLQVTVNRDGKKIVCNVVLGDGGGR